MSNRSTANILGIISFSFALACSDAISPADRVFRQLESTSLRALQRPVLRTLDDDFEELAQQAPGFGGLFYDDAGRLNVYLKNPAVRTQLEPTLVSFLSRRDQALASAKRNEVARMNVLPARFDYVELATWYRQIASIFNTPGIILTDIDEVHNRLVLGVVSEAGRSTVAGKLRELGTPTGLVSIEKMPPVRVASANLQSLVRPVPASVQIAFSGYICTLGWNAYYRDAAGIYDGSRYFITASHCSDATWANTGTRFGQPDVGNYIGLEVADPAPFDNSANSLCPTGYQCRYSDALLARYTKFVGWNHGHFPTVINSAPFEITGYKIFQSDDAQWGQVPPELYAGLSLEKTGRTTGRTTGTLLNTCVGILVYEGGLPTTRWMPCQFQANNLSIGPGDSGSPVYHTNYNGDANPLFGIVWGIQYNNNVVGAPLRTTFSHVWYVHRELSNAIGGGWFDVNPGACGFCGY